MRHETDGWMRAPATSHEQSDGVAHDAVQEPDTCAMTALSQRSSRWIVALASLAALVILGPVSFSSLPPIHSHESATSASNPASLDLPTKPLSTAVTPYAVNRAVRFGGNLEGSKLGRTVSVTTEGISRTEQSVSYGSTDTESSSQSTSDGSDRQSDQRLGSNRVSVFIPKCTEAAGNAPVIHRRAHTLNLASFKAVPDGTTDSTAAFRAAISEVQSLVAAQAVEVGGDTDVAVGATLVVPRGTWLTGPFNLTSHMTLFLEQGATILASPQMQDYPFVPQPPTYGPGRELGPGPRHHSLILAYNVTDVLITGEHATIDGSGRPWWDAMDRKSLHHMRPHVIEIQSSCHVAVSNLTLLNAPFWFIRPLYSSRLSFRHLTISAPTNVRQTDGIDPDSSTHVLIEDCHISTGDDAVAIKSGWDQYGYNAHPPAPSADITVRRVTVEMHACMHTCHEQVPPGSGSVGLSIGSEMSGGVQGVRFEDCRVLGADVGIRIKSAAGRGGFVRNCPLPVPPAFYSVSFIRTYVQDVKVAFTITSFFGHGDPPGFDPHALPIIEDITVHGLIGKNVDRVVKIEGLEEQPIKGVTISNADVTLSEKGRPGKAWKCSGVVGGQVSNISGSLPKGKQCTGMSGDAFP
ncbi:hypothetical protein CLOM_g2563 [Closterium sp. NIES-68]|nr:hypothetical protein CLOM_g2563 [Closterium sp. NIES-68]GJP74229.1 hypothetical protein CLOP_g4849 [Closterium sp. NIES-67]